MKKLITAIIVIFIAVTTISCIAIGKKSSSSAGALEKNIMVYTTVSDAQMQYIANEFKQSTGITVNYKVVSNLNTAVKDAQNSGQNVDVVYGGNESEFVNMTNEGLLTPASVSFSSELNKQYTNNEGYWYGTSVEPIVMFYNTAYMLPKDAPTAWYQLGTPYYYNRIVMPNTDLSVTQTALGSIGYQYSKSQVAKDYDTFLQGLRNNVLSYGATEQDVFNIMKTNKEAAISFGTLNEVQSQISNGAHFTIINPADGSPMIMNGVGVIKNGQNINSAKLFVEFLAGPNMQLQLANKFNLIPTMATALTYAPSWMQNYDSLNIANIDWQYVSQNSAAAVAKFNSLTKAAKAPDGKEFNLEKPVIDVPLIPSQQKALDAKKPEDQKAEEAKAKATEAKAQAEAKAKAAEAKQTQAQKAALNSLQTLGEGNTL
ncbi:MAG: ABC transporter substrate-binding protein [Sarcina sp.]